MEIKVNGQPLDFTLEKEETVGEVLAGIEVWLTGSGNRITEISIDGKIVTSSMVEDVFPMKINTINCLDIHTDIIANLAAASLTNLLDDINIFEKMDFSEKKNFFSSWKESSCARFIYTEYLDLFTSCVNTFSFKNTDPSSLRAVTEERLREIREPVNEFQKIEPVLNEICQRLVDLPLDIQTGKDKYAAQTIQLFSAVTEKIIRIFRQIDIQGYIEAASGQKERIVNLINEFSVIMKELLESYEKNDSVLVGDCAEYEASPGLKKIYTAILESVRDIKVQVEK
ncbi:MAG: hypothetical protein FWB83_03200 [Treponema sp.]|nr:hypothetical protein [Treponema sp.]